MNRSFLVALALASGACAGARTNGAGVSSATNPSNAGPLLSSPIARADIDARLTDGRLRVAQAPRLEDGEFRPGSPRVRVEGDVVSASVCVNQGRPAPPDPRLVVDGASRLYVVLPRVAEGVEPPSGGDGPHYTTQCSSQRYRLPVGVSFGATLETTE